MRDTSESFQRKLAQFVEAAGASLDRARSAREGFSPVFKDTSGFESAPIRLPPSQTPISDNALNAIVTFEVSGEQAYNRLYQRPLWPGGQSGVTIGIGYDLGYASEDEFQADWNGALDQAALDRLKTVLGKAGGPSLNDAAMKALAQSVQDVATPFAAANSVFRERSIPLYVALTEHSLQNTSALGQNSLGALVSLVYNRGASFGRPDDRYAEMRSIAQHMQEQAFARIPDDLRAMKRLWPDAPGLQKRRDLEADLFAMDL